MTRTTYQTHKSTTEGRALTNERRNRRADKYRATPATVATQRGF
jgi:hypothetical protein